MPRGGSLDLSAAISLARAEGSCVCLRGIFLAEFLGGMGGLRGVVEEVGWVCLWELGWVDWVVVFGGGEPVEGG